MPTLVLIDGHAIIHRAYHAYPPLTTHKGELVNAVYGFTSILLTVLGRLCPEYVAVAFDKKAPTFRHLQFKAYKAHRKPVDQELIEQIPRVHEVVQALNIPIFEIDGFEADDVIGTLAKQAGDKDNKLDVNIITGDADALQLVNGLIKVYMPPRGKNPEKIFDEKEVLKVYGLQPEQIIGLKALSGDASDGIPGVDGIGPKTATRLLQQFPTIKDIYDNLGLVEGKVKEKLVKGKEQALLSEQLATIITEVPIELNLEKCRLSDYNIEAVTQLFEKLEFRTLLKRLPKTEQKQKAKIDNKQMNLF